MLRYIMAAQALRAFSINGTTKRLYRAIGNRVGGRARTQGLPSHYLSRADDNLSRLEAAGGIRDGMKVMEIGTGWAHWEALFVRSFYEVEAKLMDVWDNRQFGGFHRFATELLAKLDETKRTEQQKERARETLSRVIQCQSFPEVYDLLGFDYVIGVDEAYSSVPDGTLDVIFSSDVLEHVPASAVPDMLTQHYRMLKTGGVCSHQVVPSDHLCIYDKAVNNKNYLRYGDKSWNLFFANDVQYINRLQMSEWTGMYAAAGFSVDSTVVARVDISDLNIASKFRQLPDTDLPVTVFHLLARK
ncbi:class I SAM-dependent methyltransferase [Sphingomonas sp. ID1715]|uniref:SAM-dependent methyltransferase n=1 Tax=Sphingomonas sp. ID1715 TaxID=1656898 RepID=UPI001489B07D|nr:class I SAM-dependent methyltransferase [Sphingomonas sp. ID1715]NNM75956.1 class I SAM-dependent methyltransferase [Sphingomonas sp. ID1715]